VLISLQYWSFPFVHKAQSSRFADMLVYKNCSPFSLTPTPLDAFLSLPKPLPILNPRWHLLDHNAIACQNATALQAK